VRRAGRRLLLVAFLGAGAWLATSDTRAVDHDLAKDLRDRYERRTLRLRVDLRSATSASEPNRISLEGMGYGRETAPVLFYRLEAVWVERVTSEGGTRLSLTIYRSQDEALRMRAVSIPSAAVGNPAGANTMSTYARGGSTSVFVELHAGRKDPEAQRRETDALMGQLFYLEGEPALSDLEAFVLEHRSWSVTKLSSITGLKPDDVRALTTAPSTEPTATPPATSPPTPP
jgi:hypothetical protein